jgi:methylated-DNA-protein-cysteine methyltransferase related protein
MRSLTEQVLACVDAIPPGRVLTYGDIAEFVGMHAARQVGRIMATEGMDVPWYRVVRADGSCAEHIRAEQLMLLRVDGVPLRGDRVDLAKARWDGRSPE